MTDPRSHAEAGAAIEDVADETQLVPIWLAALVLVLLLSVVGVGGFVLRGLFVDPQPRSAEELEVERWKDVVAENPQDVRSVLSLGFAFQQVERYDEALEAYRRALEISPGEPAANYNCGVVYTRLDLEDKAEEAFWDVLEEEPDHALAAKALGEYYASKREYRSLLEAVRPVVEAKPQMSDLQYLMGLAYENLGRTDWAEARYRLALKYMPDMKEARDGLKRLEGE